MEVAGIIEGFYGAPWSWDERVEVCRWAAARGMTDYVYAPKDDPKHRVEWRAPYDRAELAGFERVAAEGGLRLGFAISPGLSIDPDDPDELALLAAKVDQGVAAGSGLAVLALDDIPFGGGDQGAAHARLTTWLRAHLGDRAALAMVPTEYVGTRSTAYLDALAAGLPDDVAVGWTGPTVVPATITAAQARARAGAVGGRPPLLWDNAAANDAVMTDRLPVGPLRGREAALRAELAGYALNPPVQALAARLPIASAAGWLADGDPDGAWAEACDELGARVLAEACDGARPRALVDALLTSPDPDGSARRTLDAWLEDLVAACGAGSDRTPLPTGLGAGADPWVEQARREARLAQRALDLLDAARPALGADGVGADDVLALAARWGAARRADRTVLGERYAVHLRMGQRADGTWSVEPGTVTEGNSAVDALVRAALTAAGALTPHD